MNFKQILPYKLRRALTIGAIAGSTLTACEKNNEPQEPITPTRDVELEFYLPSKQTKVANLDTIQKYTDMPNIRYVYIVPINELEWSTCDTNNIKALHTYLQKRINVNPQKVRGKGNFCFKPGEASKIPQDSLWFIQNGWTLNQK